MTMFDATLWFRCYNPVSSFKIVIVNSIEDVLSARMRSKNTTKEVWRWPIWTGCLRAILLANNTKRILQLITICLVGSFCLLSTTMYAPPCDVPSRNTRSSSMRAEMDTCMKHKRAGGKEDSAGPLPRGTQPPLDRTLSCSRWEGQKRPG